MSTTNAFATAATALDRIRAMRRAITVYRYLYDTTIEVDGTGYALLTIGINSTEYSSLDAAEKALAEWYVTYRRGSPA